MKSVTILDKRDITSEWKELIVFILDSVENKDGFLHFIFLSAVKWQILWKLIPDSLQRNELNLPIGRQLKARQKCSFPNPLAFSFKYLLKKNQGGSAAPQTGTAQNTTLGMYKKFFQLYNINKNAFHEYFTFFLEHCVN